MEKVSDFVRHQYAYALLRKALHQRVDEFLEPCLVCRGNPEIGKAVDEYSPGSSALHHLD
jgi:hypothetical protein